MKTSSSNARSMSVVQCGGGKKGRFGIEELVPATIGSAAIPHCVPGIAVCRDDSGTQPHLGHGPMGIRTMPRDSKNRDPRPL